MFKQYPHSQDLKVVANRCVAVQDASNIGGVVHFAKEVSTALYSSEDCQGSDWVASHPIMICVVDKLASMTATQTLNGPVAERTTAAHWWLLAYVENRSKAN